MLIHVWHRDDKIAEIMKEGKKVFVRDSTNDKLLSPFGLREMVTSEELDLFLKSRCIPSTRENVKEFLIKLGLKYFSILDIIEITHGWMAEDNFWLTFDDEEISWEEVNSFNESL